MRLSLVAPVATCALLAAAAAVAPTPAAANERVAENDGAAATAKTAKAAKTAKTAKAAKPWCAPEVHELSDHVCYAEGPVPESGRRTLVVYMHGALAASPGFFWLQQRAMALHAKRLGFTVLIPTSPMVKGSYVWPSGEAAQKEHEASLLAGLKKARTDLEKRVGHGFDETFVVGFSSGAYYASSAAVRGVLDVDGFVVLAGGSSWVRNAADVDRRAPVFVGVSAADKMTAAHSRAFAGTLASLGWPFKVEERNAGHEVDWALLGHGIAWLRARAVAPKTGGLERASVRR